MSFPQDTMLQLMAFADGELEGDAHARIEALVAKSSEARLIVQAMRSPALGAWLTDEMSTRAVAADGIADEVMASIAKTERAGQGGGAEVVRLGDRGRARKPRVQIVAGVVVAALALAAGVTLYVSSVAPSTDGVKAPVASVGIPSVDIQVPPTPPAAIAQGQSQGVEVDEVDSPSRGFSVFEIPAGGTPAGAAKAAAPSSVVILFDDDPGAK